MWPKDEETLVCLERIREAFGPLADAGDDAALTIVTVVEQMMLDVEIDLRDGPRVTS